jgi:signal transduction histidine kinase
VHDVELEIVMRSHALIGLAGLAAGVGAAALALESDREAAPRAAAVLAIVVGLSYVVSGLLAWRQRPDSRLGPVMIFIGFAWFATFLGDSGNALLFTIGTAVEAVYLVGFVYLILAFPTGRLPSRADRALFGSAVVLAVVVELTWLVFAEPEPVFCDTCPENLLQVERNDSLASGLLDGQRAIGAVLSLLTIAVLIRRWRRASAPSRRAGAPVLWTGSAMFAALVFSVTNDIFDEPLGQAPGWMLSFTFAAVPVAVLAVLLQRRLARAAVAGLVIELGDGDVRVDLRQAVARALGDPSLELAYWVPAAGRYVDAGGRPVDLPEEDATRATTLVERGGEPVAALVHDPALRDEPELVDSVCAAAALALENERLQAELRGRLEDLRASRARIVEAAEVERRRIERNLHDGAQQQLVSVAMTLGLAQSKLTSDPGAASVILGEARARVSAALAELRELSHGIHPGILTERGLGPALGELALRSTVPVELAVSLDRRLPDRVEAAAYYVVSEALANVVKYARATVARVWVERLDGKAVIEVADDGIGGADGSRGSGLHGLADRVEALGGRLSLVSPRGNGTIVRAEIPCG